MTVAATAAPAAAAAALEAPTGLRTAEQACDTVAPGPFLSPARLPYGDGVPFSLTATGGSKADFELWDLARPEQRWQQRDDLDIRDQAFFRAGDDAELTDGATYAWRARILDGTAASPWSETCHFTIDRTAGAPPTVTSPDYPGHSTAFLGGWEPGDRGGIGLPIRFAVTPGADDIVSYSYTFAPGNGDVVRATVPAERLGGPAAFTVTPQRSGLFHLRIVAVDRAANESDVYVTVQVRHTKPLISSTAYTAVPDDYERDLDYTVGSPGDFLLRTRVADAAFFRWRTDDGQSGTVDADAEGAATVSIAPRRSGAQSLTASVVSRDGYEYPEDSYEFFVDNGPVVTHTPAGVVQLGTTPRFRLTPRARNVESYRVWPVYGSNREQPSEAVIVPAGPDGTAEIGWRITTTDLASLYAESISAGGEVSTRRTVDFTTGDARPALTLSGGGDLITPLTVTARSPLPGVTEYEAVFNDDPATRQVVPAASDGSGTFRFTTRKIRTNGVQVVARDAAGLQSGESRQTWSVVDWPEVSSTDWPGSGTGRKIPGTFSFAPRVPATVAYEWRVLPSTEWKSLPARADGHGTLAWTPATTGGYTMYVRSVAADGSRSALQTHRFTVALAAGHIDSVSPASVMTGGVRKLTITGENLDPRDTVTVTPEGRAAVTAKITSADKDGYWLVAEADLAGVPAGRAVVHLDSYGGNGRNPWTHRDATITVTPLPALKATAKPTVTGSTKVGGTVRATAGTFAPAATAVKYQWKADGVTIKGATASSYAIPAAQAGKRLTVTVTAARTGHTSTSATSASTAVVAKGAASKATRKPKVTGTAKVGKTVRVSVGTWSPKVTSYTYEWRLNGTVVKGATGASLKLKASMRKKKVTVTVIARRTGYLDGRATSVAVKVS